MAPSSRSAPARPFAQGGARHETTSASRLTALILEGDGLRPYRRS